MLYGGAEQESSADQTAVIAQELYNTNLLLQLVLDLPKIEFEVCSLGYHNANVVGVNLKFGSYR